MVAGSPVELVDDTSAAYKDSVVNFCVTSE